MANWAGSAGQERPRFLFQALLVLVIVSVLGAARVESAPVVITQARVAACTVSNCCLQSAGTSVSTVTPFVPPASLPPSAIRPRLSLQTAFLNATYLAQYRLAVQLLKANGQWEAQRRAHCAYATPSALTNVHGRWLFLAWHRWYLYFHEKKMQAVLGDPTFRLPFWNWDASIGRVVPSQYTATTVSSQPNSLYDSLRNPNPANTQSQLNSFTSTTQLQAAVKNSYSAATFHGGATSSGTVEGSPHGGVHVAVGQQNAESKDMGNLQFASNDALFYVHHNNIDRLWNVWRTLPPGPNGGSRSDPTSTDWLNSQFIFYDENNNLRSVLVRDSVSTQRLGYTFQNVANPWNTAKKRRRQLLADESDPLAAAASLLRPEPSLNNPVRRHLLQAANLTNAPLATGPIDIVEPTTVAVKLVQRTKRSGFKAISRNLDGKILARGSKNTEVLKIQGLQPSQDRPLFINFFVNNPTADINTEPSTATNFCGSYVHMVTGAQGAPEPRDIQIPLTACLAVAGSESDPGITIQIVPFVFSPDTNEKVPLPGFSARFNSVTVEYD